MAELTYGDPSPSEMTYDDYLAKYMAEMGVAAANGASPKPRGPSAPSGGTGAGAGGILPVALGAKLGSSIFGGGGASTASSFLGSGGAPLAQHHGALLSGTQGAATPAATPGLTLAGAAPYLGAAGAGLGAYGVYNAIQDDDAGAGALSGAGLGLGLGMAAPLVGLGPVGWGGLALMAGAGALGGGGLTSLLGHKSIAERQRERWGNLRDDASNPATAAFAKQYIDYLNSDVDHPGAREDFNKKMAEGRATYKDVWGAQGLLELIGDPWLTELSVDQRIAASNEMLAQKLFRHSGGDLKLTDNDAVLDIVNKVKSGALPAPVVAAPQVNKPAMPDLEPQVIAYLKEQFKNGEL